MSDQPLNFELALSRQELPADQTSTLHLVASFEGGLRPDTTARPPMSVVFVLDISGSMAGAPLEHVVQSVDKLVALLQPDDRVGIVAFSSRATEVVPLSRVDRETIKLVRRRIHRLFAEGTTNIEHGLNKARAMLPPRNQHERQVILLLSDGAPNEGRSSAEELGALVSEFRPDVGLSSLGYGAHHNEDILAGLADAGGGLYHFVPNPIECDYEFARAIGQQGDIVAEGIEVALRPMPGVEIERVVGRRRTRFGADGLVIEMPDLPSGGQSFAVAQLRVKAPLEHGPFEVIHASVRFRAAGREETHINHASLSARAGVPGPLCGPDMAYVMLARTDEVRADARAQADRGQFESAAAIIRQLIEEIRKVPGYVEADGSPLSEACELLLDEAMAFERRPSQEAYRAFKRSSLTVNVSTQGTDASQIRNLTDVSRQIVLDATGNYAPAELIAVGGPMAGQRFELSSDQVLGRTPTADIRVLDSRVSRKHSRITARNGHFFIFDLGSTNPTYHNGEPVVAPVQLDDGDLIRLGDCVMRYRLK